MVACILLRSGQIHQQHEGSRLLSQTTLISPASSITIDVNDNAPHVQRLHVNAVGFQRQASFIISASGYLPR